MNFCGLHNHTEYSNLKLRDCIVKIKDLVNKAIEYGYKGIAITDHEIISGHIEALKIRDKILEEHPDFKLMLGNEIYLINSSEYKNNPKYYHFILIAKDNIGYSQIRALSSRAWERAYVERGMLRTPTFYQDIEEIVGQNSGHLIASTACLGGELDNAILNQDADTINRFIPWMIQNFGANNTFLEMQDSDSEEQKKVNETIINLAAFFGLDYIITSDVHYLLKEDFDVHHAFLNSKEEKERETEAFYKYTYLKTEEEICNILKYLPSEVVHKGMENTIKVYNMVENFDTRQGTIVPVRKPETFIIHHIFKNWYEKYPVIKQFADSQFEQDRYLLYLIEQGIKAKNFPITEEAVDRINTELDVIWYISERLNQRLSAYLNLVKNIVDIIWQVSFVGVSRGSAGCFLINYLIGITQMNPLQYHIPYWRFANKERVDMMDIDIDVNPAKVPDIISLLRDYYGDDNVLNCLTFRTESTKSAILTACRGRDINSDDAQTISSMVPSERGKLASLDECIHGNEEKDMAPVPGFVEMLNKYGNLKQTVEGIEGLISGRGIHASALYIFNDGYLAQNSLMRAPNGTLETGFDMHDSDDMGALKFDLLSTELQTKFMKTFELLLNDNVIQWQGTLRDTYNKYLHPDVLNYTNPKMWQIAAEGKIMNMFQFEGTQGQICIRKTKPGTVSQMGAANAVMRLGATESFMPIERYVDFKDNIQHWYDEMNNAELTQDEVKVLEGYLLEKFGCSIEQEDMMLLLMDENISNFTLGEANMARKIVAKKKVDQLAGLKELFYTKGAKARKEFLDYVWKFCITPQLGYSFSIPHDIAYSIEALQQMNLVTNYNPLYWDCACLSVNSGSSNTDFDAYTINQDEEEGDYDIEAKENTTNYGKIAKAIGEVQQQGIKVLLPDINVASRDFTPDVEHNAIIYGLQGVSGVNIDMINQIIDNRPYTSLEDFCHKVDFTKVQMINLIKSGAFDNIEHNNREYIMDKYLTMFAKNKITLKEGLTMANYKKALDYNIIPGQFETMIKMKYYKEWIDANCVELDLVGKKYYKLNDYDAIKFFEVFVKNHLTLGKDYDILIEGYTLKMQAFTKFYNNYIKDLKDWLKTTEAAQKFYEAEINADVSASKEKYCQGNVSRWEMDSMSFYYHKHELYGVISSKYNIKNFETMPTEPVPSSYKTNPKTGLEYPVYDIYRICGTVLDSNKIKHIVTILTTNGVVDVKFYSAEFNKYNQRISKIDNKGVKHVIENSWFTKGNKLLISGIRKENMFVPRKDFNNGYNTSVQLINDISNGTLILKKDREKGD